VKEIFISGNVQDDTITCYTEMVDGFYVCGTLSYVSSLNPASKDHAFIGLRSNVNIDDGGIDIMYHDEIIVGSGIASSGIRARFNNRFKRDFFFFVKIFYKVIRFQCDWW
jgi:hypothetical protein